MPSDADAPRPSSEYDPNKFMFDDQARELLSGLMEEMEAKSPETRNHMEDVGRCGVFIAQKIKEAVLTGKPPKLLKKISPVTAKKWHLIDRNDYLVGDAQFFYFPCALHDLGKLDIPPEILNKPGRLTEEERIIVDQHRTFGAIRAKNIMDQHGHHPQFDLLVSCCLHHHDKFSEHGLSTPLIGRIVKCGEILSVHLKKRPEKDPYPRSESKRRLMEGDDRNQPSDFDPVVLAIVLEHFDALADICEQNDLKDEGKDRITKSTTE